MTYIEVLVCCSVIVAILSLLTPAYVQARSAARRVGCLNNMKQLCLALNVYNVSFECLPAGRVARELPTYGGGASAYVSLLPYLDQAYLFLQIGNAPIVEMMSPAAKVELSTTICREDPGSELRSAAPRVNYMFNTGDTYPVSVRNPLGVPVTGPFYENSFLKFEDMQDGLSCTVFLSETVRLHSSKPRRSTAPSAGWRQAVPTAKGYPQLVDPETQCLPDGTLLMSRGTDWLFGGPGTSLYNHARAPNSHIDDCRDGNPSVTAAPEERARLSHDTAARSWHRGGVNAGMGDGSVKMISSDIDPQIWRDLGNRSDGNEISGY